MKISFFEDGNAAIGVDYGYTPETKTTETYIDRFETDENWEEKAITAEREVLTPATGRPDCIHVEDVESIPEGTKPVLKTNKKGEYIVSFEPAGDL